MMLPRGIEELRIHNCDLDCSGEYPLFSRFILFSPASFSSLKYLPPPAPDSVSIQIKPKEWWESVEWDAKPLLKPIFL
ncbi:hypothetical protein V6N12_054082 [Hibiscus sabdariffa]|uniref:Uncharacterized protein n=1 Tax=Hibiscus sabdariffa TaxID=183260 RepID=A0ABR1ZXG8_9ROSI